MKTLEDVLKIMKSYDPYKSDQQLVEILLEMVVKKYQGEALKESWECEVVENYDSVHLRFRSMPESDEGSSLWPNNKVTPLTIIGDLPNDLVINDVGRIYHADKTIALESISCQALDDAPVDQSLIVCVKNILKAWFQNHAVLSGQTLNNPLPYQELITLVNVPSD